PLREKLQAELETAYQQKEEQVGAKVLRQFEQQVMLQVLDTRWKEHLQSMDQLRQGIHLRGYAQKNPKQEYKREAFGLFEHFLVQVRSDVVRILSHVRIRTQEEVEAMEQQRRQEAERLRSLQQARHAESTSATAGTPQEGGASQPFKRNDPKVGRNDPCPCGSGKKYKQCHGQLQ
ncbi:SEC-C metal-binding domain-containing protein, partial [Marinospirillum sp.]|uniref:SEC-C metal-binding domain-containing protein n=1 Tax=Marinospirillum sp. TaxID=2183934 RepID=UPI003A83C3E7